jgi:hypothetical protein
VDDPAKGHRAAGQKNDGKSSRPLEAGEKN